MNVFMELHQLIATYKYFALPALSYSRKENKTNSLKDLLSVFLLDTVLNKKGLADPHAKKLRISRHVTFWEQVPFFSLPPHKPPATETEILIDPFHTDPDSSNPTERIDHSNELPYIGIVLLA